MTGHSQGAGNRAVRTETVVEGGLTYSRDRKKEIKACALFQSTTHDRRPQSRAAKELGKTCRSKGQGREKGLQQQQRERRDTAWTPPHRRGKMMQKVPMKIREKERVRLYLNRDGTERYDSGGKKAD